MPRESQFHILCLPQMARMLKPCKNTKMFLKQGTESSRLIQPCIMDGWELGLTVSISNSGPVTEVRATDQHATIVENEDNVKEYVRGYVLFLFSNSHERSLLMRSCKLQVSTVRCILRGALEGVDSLLETAYEFTVAVNHCSCPKSRSVSQTYFSYITQPIQLFIPK